MCGVTKSRRSAAPRAGDINVHTAVVASGVCAPPGLEGGGVAASTVVSYVMSQNTSG